MNYIKWIWIKIWTKRLWIKLFLLRMAPGLLVGVGVILVALIFMFTISAINKRQSKA